MHHFRQGGPGSPHLVRIYRRSVARGRHHTGAVAHHRAGREAPRSDRIPAGDNKRQSMRTFAGAHAGGITGGKMDADPGWLFGD